MRIETQQQAKGAAGAKAKTSEPGLPQTLVYVDGKSAKFYTVDVKKNVVHIKFGRLGSAGQTHLIPAADHQAALAVASARISEKQRGGYVSNTGGTRTTETTHEPTVDAMERPVKAKATSKAPAFTEMSWSELEEKIQAHYGHEYETVACEEWSNDSQHVFTVGGKVDEYDRARVETFKRDGSGRYILDALINDMAAQGLIPKGKLIVSVCW